MSVSQHQCQQVQCGCLSQADIGAANFYDCSPDVDRAHAVKPDPSTTAEASANV
jgi:hypothetical protein